MAGLLGDKDCSTTEGFLLSVVCTVSTRLQFNSGVRRPGFLQYDLAQSSLKQRVRGGRDVTIVYKKDFDEAVSRYLETDHQGFIVFSMPSHRKGRTFDLDTLRFSTASIKEEKDALVRTIERFAFAANLSQPSSIILRSNAWLLDMQLFGFDSNIHGSFESSYRYNERNRLDLIRNLSYADTVSWIDAASVDNPALKRFRKALSYCDKCHSLDDSQEARLIWAIAGIEALLGERSESVTRTLVSKLRILLGGNSDAIEKIFRSLYQIRSNIVHGDLPADGTLSRHHELKNDVFDSISDAYGAAELFLVALLQNCVANNRKLLDFELTLKGP